MGLLDIDEASWAGFWAALLTPLILWWLFSAARNQKPRIEGNTLIFPVASSVRVFMGIGAMFFGSLAALPAVGAVTDDAWWIELGFVLLALVCVFLCIGEIRIDEMGMEKRFLRWRKAISWGNVDAIVKRWDGSTVVAGQGIEISFSICYASFERLKEEIRNRAPALSKAERKGGLTSI